MTDMLRFLRDGSLTTTERLKVASVVARNDGHPCLRDGKITFLAKWACEEICRIYGKKGRSVKVSTSMRREGIQSPLFVNCIIELKFLVFICLQGFCKH